MVVPTLPDLTSGVNEDAERLAEATQLIAQARQSYLVDVNAAFTACDDTLRAATGMADPSSMADAMADALGDLREDTCARYQEYDTDVRAILAALSPTCPRNP